MEFIKIRGARTHNLKNINLDIPRNRLVVITGLSGSGKSSLAFDTLYAEGQRRYVESLSAYARQFLQMMEKPDVDLIEGLSPAISIEQKATSHNPRSTVGTVTEIHDYLRLLYARVGDPYCPEHQVLLSAQTVSQMVDQVLALPAVQILYLYRVARPLPVQDAVQPQVSSPRGNHAREAGPGPRSGDRLGVTIAHVHGRRAPGRQGLGGRLGFLKQAYAHSVSPPPEFIARNNGFAGLNLSTTLRVPSFFGFLDFAG